MKATLLGLVLAAVVLAGVILLRGKDEVAPGAAAAAKQASVTVNRRLAPDAVLAIKPGAPAAARARPAAAKQTALMEEFASRRGRKAMYDRLSRLASPTAEEMYVLAEILHGCRHSDLIKARPTEAMRAEARERALRRISEKDPTRDKRIAALDSLRGGEPLCLGFEDMTVKAADVRALLARAADAGDPRARARLVETDVWAPLMGPNGLDMRPPSIGQPMTLPRITDAQLATLREAVASHDPAVLSVAARLLSSTMAELEVRAGPEERAIDPGAFHDAWALAACDAGEDCGPRHPSLASGCLSFGHCDARDLREYLFFYQNSVQQSQLVAEYQGQIARAIQTGDWSYFQFHRGPSETNMMVMRPPP